MQHVQAELDQKKLDFEQRMLKCKQKEAELGEKQQKIRDSVMRFEKFVKENDAKRARAIKKERDEINTRRQKELEIISLRAELERLAKKKEDMSSLLERLMVYEKYLDSVIEYEEAFQEIDDILMRNVTLEASNQDLKVYATEGEGRTDRMRVQLAEYTKQMESKMLVFTSKIAGQQKDTDRLRIQNTKLDELQQYRETHAVDKKRDVGEAKMAINNIFHRCKKSGIQAPRSDDQAGVWRMLEYISQRMVDLGDISEMTEDHLTRRQTGR